MAESKQLILVSSSKLSVNDLLDKIPKEACVQLFEAKAIACREHLEFAYLNALKLLERKEAKSKSLSMELLLCAAMTSQIGDAIKLVGAKSNKRFVVFADNKRAFEHLSQYLEGTAEFKPSKGETEARIKRLGIKSGTVQDLIQEIALKSMNH